MVLLGQKVLVLAQTPQVLGLEQHRSRKPLAALLCWEVRGAVVFLGFPGCHGVLRPSVSRAMQGALPWGWGTRDGAGAGNGVPPHWGLERGSL